MTDVPAIRTQFTGDLKTLSVFDDRIEELKQQIQSLTQEVRILEKQKENIRSKMLEIMQGKGVEYVKVVNEHTGQVMEVKVRPSPGKVTLAEGVTLDQIPDEYKRTTVELDKAAIKAALKPRPTRPGQPIFTGLEGLVDIVKENVLQIGLEETDEARANRTGEAVGG